jgi:hypothetical protein
MLVIFDEPSCAQNPQNLKDRKVVKNTVFLSRCAMLSQHFPPVVASGSSSSSSSSTFTTLYALSRIMSMFLNVWSNLYTLEYRRWRANKNGFI